jgi:hypothetical protein
VLLWRQIVNAHPLPADLRFQSRSGNLKAAALPTGNRSQIGDTLLPLPGEPIPILVTLDVSGYYLRRTSTLELKGETAVISRHVQASQSLDFGPRELV